MATRVVVPRLGEGVEEVTVSKWLKQEGDSVKELEPLLEVNTDKVDTEVPSPASGTVLKIVAQEGAPARVGTVLAFIGKPGESLDSAATVEASGGDGNPPAPSKSQVQPAPTPSAAPVDRQPSTAGRDMGFISPVVARIAAEQGVDLSQVQGTGMDGRITKNDVLQFVEGGRQGSTVRAAQAQPPQVTATPGDRLIKHTTIRRQIAEHMVLSQKTSRRTC
jgi:pyruvate dehydrogenase E2 component (dihydrolipoamide acetyltransferase)